MKREAVAEEITRIVSVCKSGREKPLPETFRLSVFSPANRTRIRGHLRRRCDVDLSPAAFKKLKTLGDLIDHVAPLLEKRRKAFPKQWHLP